MNEAEQEDRIRAWLAQEGKVENMRERLASVSEFMKNLAEPIARAANASLGAILQDMNARVDHVLEDLLRLPAEERSAVAAALIDSLETDQEPSITEAWRTELIQRRADLRAGVVRAAPWSDVRARLSSM